MDAIHELYHALTTSDYVLVGAGAGLSAAAGISFADERAFKRDYPALWAQGVHSDYQTFSYKGWLPGQRWGYLCRHIKAVLLDTPALPLYDDLKALLEGSDYFAVTSNVDHQFIKAGFPPERVFEAQGSYGELVCSARCSDDEYDIAPFIDATLPHIKDDLTVDAAHHPHCPRRCARLFATPARMPWAISATTIFSQKAPMPPSPSWNLASVSTAPASSVCPSSASPASAKKRASSASPSIILTAKKRSPTLRSPCRSLTSRCPSTATPER